MDYLKYFIQIVFIIAACDAQPGQLANSGQLGNIDVSRHLSIFEQQRYPLEEPYKKAWLDARQYIIREFESYGLATQSQYFRTETATFQNILSKVDGVNIIGEAKSKNLYAPLFLVGAHYDSTFTQLPLKENGVSMAVLLEVAKNFQILKQSGNFIQDTSVIFVAFDLNVRSYIPEGSGKPGSAYFVKDWLAYYMNGRKFLGALILDSISTFNSDINSQSIESFAEIFPQSAENIRQSEFRANFLALVSRSDLANQYQVQNMITRYHEANLDNIFRLEDFTLPDGARLPRDIRDKVIKNPVYSFWNKTQPLPAMFLTDIMKTRTDFDVLHCSETCPLNQFWNQERATFVGRTAEAVLQLVLHNQLSGNDLRASVVASGNSLNSIKCYSYYLSSLFLVLGLVYKLG